MPSGGDQWLLLQPQPHLQGRGAVLPQCQGGERRDGAADVPRDQSAASR